MLYVKTLEIMVGTLAAFLLATFIFLALEMNSIRNLTTDNAQEISSHHHSANAIGSADFMSGTVWAGDHADLTLNDLYARKK